MKLKIKVGDTTTAAELRLLGTFFSGLANEYAVTAFAIDPEVFIAPTDEAELPPTNDTAGTVEGDTAPLTPKRKRRTKAEIEADVAAAAKASAEAANRAANRAANPVVVVEEGPFYWSHPESSAFGMCETRVDLESVLTGDLNTVTIDKVQYDALVAADAKKEVAPEPNPTSSPAPTPSASEAGAPAASEPAAESPSDTKTYTPAEVQKIAVATAGRFGPEKVKAIIAQYPGAARIADLPLSELAGFVAKLNAVS